jgi:hypothetical protein
MILEHQRRIEGAPQTKAALAVGVLLVLLGLVVLLIVGTM